MKQTYTLDLFCETNVHTQTTVPGALRHICWNKFSFVGRKVVSEAGTSVMPVGLYVVTEQKVTWAQQSDKSVRKLKNERLHMLWMTELEGLAEDALDIVQMTSGNKKELTSKFVPMVLLQGSEVSQIVISWLLSGNIKH